MCECCAQLKLPRGGRHERSAGSILNGWSRGNCHVHHLTYERIGNELVSDLLVVCGECHEQIHAWIDKQVAKGRDKARCYRRLQGLLWRRLLKLNDNCKDFRW